MIELFGFGLHGELSPRLTPTQSHQATLHTAPEAARASTTTAIPSLGIDNRTSIIEVLLLGRRRRSLLGNFTSVPVRGVD